MRAWYSRSDDAAPEAHQAWWGTWERSSRSAAAISQSRRSPASRSAHSGQAEPKVGLATRWDCCMDALSLVALFSRKAIIRLERRGRHSARSRSGNNFHAAGSVRLPIVLLTARSEESDVKRLRDKLRDDAREPRYITTVRGAGYRFEAA